MRDPGEFIQVQKITFSNRIIVVDTAGNRFELLDYMQYWEEQKLYENSPESLKIFIVTDCCGNVPGKASIKCYDKLITYYFTDRIDHDWEKWKEPDNYKDIWCRRWRESERQDVTISYISANSLISSPVYSMPKTWKENGFDGPNCDWFLTVLRDNNDRPKWVMPVFGSFGASSLDAPDFCFTPTDFFDDTEYKYNLPCWYVKNSDQLPKKRLVTLKNRLTGEKKKVRLVLHGFFHFSRLYCKFWQHVVGERPDPKFPDSPEQEKQAWQAWLACGHGIKNRQLKKIRTIKVRHSNFIYSTEKEEQEINKIFQNNATVKKYLEKMVTSFQHSQTLKIQIGQAPNCSLVVGLFNMLGKNLAAHNKDHPSDHKYPHLSCRVTCFNWGEAIPVMHLGVQSFFLKNEKKLEGKDWGEYENRLASRQTRDMETTEWELVNHD